MKKLLLLFCVTLLMSSCVTYVRETGRFYSSRHRMKQYHHFGINGLRLRNRVYKKYLYPRRPPVRPMPPVPSK